MNKTDILKAVAAEAKANSNPNKKPASKNEPWKKLMAAFNEAYFKRYSVNGIINEVKAKAVLQKILQTYNNNLELAIKAAVFYVEHYQELPFVNTKAYKRPLLGGLSTFAPQVQEYMDSKQEKPEQVEVSPTLGKIRSFLDD